ncbi:MAG: nucleotidyltransferase family protein [Planctomycetes bacterium]|nr:nucleotidyltransferase family protein [Planctomycetota bacterium]
MKALVLGAGYATRLYPLTKDRPKPLLPVDGKPILERILDSLAPIADLDQIYIVSNHRFADHFREWRKSYKSTRPIEIVDDGTVSNDDRLGAVGDIQYVLDHARIKDDLLVLAGDNLLEAPLGDFASFFHENGACVALTDVGDSELVSQYSVVELDRGGKIVSFEEKPPNPKSTLVSTCIYLFPRKHLKLIKEYLDRGHNRDAPGYYIEWLYRQVDLWGHILRGAWFDVGDIDSYNGACALFEKRRKGK